MKSSVRLHEGGLTGLSSKDRALLDRVSTRYRNRQGVDRASALLPFLYLGHHRSSAAIPRALRFHALRWGCRYNRHRWANYFGGRWSAT